MKRLGKHQREALANMAGLGMWAGSQMLLMIAVAAALSLEVVGVFSLGLTVFSLLMTALGLNLRLSIAVDEGDHMRLVPALAIRVATALAVYGVALVVMKLYAPRFDAFVLGALLLGGRVFDQIVDVFYGFQQKVGRNIFLSASFFIRGALTCLFCLCLYLWPGVTTVLVGSLAYGAACMALETLWFRGTWAPAPEGFAISVRTVLAHENTRTFSTFPIFDTLHFSGFRLAVAPVLGTQAFGLFALAVNAFSATQIVITALGLTSLARLKSGVHERAVDPMRAMLLECTGLGAICVGFFALCSLAFGLLAGLKMANTHVLDLFLLGNFAALMLFPFMAFLAQGAIFFGNRAGYWQAPLIGSLVFAGTGAALVGLGHLLSWNPMTSYFALCTALLLSCLVRVAVSLHHLRAPRPVNG